MVESAGWNVLPNALLGKILWSDHLRILDRLRCQVVCKTWKTLLSEPSSELDRTGPSHELCINFVRTATMQHHIALQLEQDPPTILVKLEQWATHTSSESCFACCRWLTLNAHLFKKVQLSGDTSPLTSAYSSLCTPQWQLQKVVRALYDAPQQTAPAVSINTLPGETSIKSFVVTQN